MPYCVYIVAIYKGGTIYIGVTGDIARRAYEHREGLVEGFSKRYRLKTLVYTELHDDVAQAIQREKTMKKWNRAWKVALIERDNPDWEDLYKQLLQ